MSLSELIGEALAGLPPLPEQRKLHVPLAEAIDDYQAWASTPHERVYTGVEALDAAMRGTAPGQLTLITGFAHSGKTLFTTKMLLHNPNRRVALFTPDETRELILVKLTCAKHGISARRLEQWMTEGNPEGRLMMQETCDAYPTLSVVDASVSIPDMERALGEMAEAWGAPVEAVVFDYAALLDFGEDIRSKVQALKSFGKQQRVSMFVLHQASRTSGRDGQVMTMTSGEYGGEKEATHLVGIRRKKSAIQALLREARETLAKPMTSAATRDRLMDVTLPELEYDLARHEMTITVSLLKNKTPPCDLVDELDLLIDPASGRILGPLESTLPLVKPEQQPSPQAPEVPLTPAMRALRKDT